MSNYIHTQPGTTMRLIIGVIALIDALVCGAILASGTPGAGIVTLSATSLLAIILLLFHSLTVSVDKNQVSLRFGIGLIRKSFPTAEIISTEPVRNHWFYGFGIRLTRTGWLYNVSGLDAVQITLQNGKQARIGTDDVE